MTLRIKPVRLNQTIYFRVPNDIADLVGLDSNAEVTLNIEEQDDRFLLKYNVTKAPIPQQLHRRIQQIQR
ncbi:MAG TPA: hypothetical protein VEG61_03240 [Candidatus Dormibacteraeota bacterium]|nr:hypothetical protein [Candidatus Dormibacteraeota bacterium]